MIVLSDYFLFSWNNRFFGEKDYSLNFRRVLRVIFSPSGIQAKMIYHVIVLQLLFYFHSISPWPLTFWWRGMFKIIGHFPQSWVGRGGGGQGGHNHRLPYPFVPLSPHRRDTDTVDTRVHVWCHLIHDLWCKRLGKVRFPISPEVMLCRFFILSTNFRFLTFLAWENVKWTLLGSFLWLDDKQ